MNNFFFFQKRHKKGFVFLLDILLTTTLLLSFVLTLLLFTSNNLTVVDSSQFSLTQSLYTTVDQSDIASDAIASASTAEFVSFLDTTIPDPFCAQVMVYTAAGSLDTNATQTGCSFTTSKLTSSIGTIVHADTVYVMEVYLWQE